jgi:hypothetical protein
MIKKIFENGNWELSPYPSYLGPPLMSGGLVSPLEGRTIISYDADEEHVLIVMSDGQMLMFGDFEKIAEGVFRYFSKESTPNIKAMVINDSLKCCFGNGISIEFVGDNKPEFFDALAAIIKRFSELRAFS